MTTTTTNFGLLKPGQEEFYNVDVPNANMDTVDRVLKLLQDAISSGASEQDLKILRDALATHLTEEASLTEAGHVMLSNLISGSSETKAATELAVKNAIAHMKGWSPNASAIIVNEDPNTTQNSLIYSKHVNNPTSDVFYYVETLFYESKNTTIGNWQFAKQDTTNEYVFVRSRYGNAWNPWRRMLTENMINVPNGVAGLDENGNINPINLPKTTRLELEYLKLDYAY